ncbi:MAG TPA: hypothetical protein VHX62_02370 [Solirubrobacteraceae bacterium]|jgi:hypothetical protein|nr:hypothetical protein [Solirubrobacteraceae bacterium]
MRRALRRHAIAIAAAAGALAALAPAAGAATSPALTLDQSAGHAAGSTANLGLDLTFANTGTDSPQDLMINLPPGLLANAAQDGGACLKTADVSGSACEVGSGTVTATADPIPGLLNLPVPVSVAVTFYLVPPPAAGDLAGLAVEGLGEQIGSTGAIRIRPSGDPDGVGVTLNLVLPDELPLTLPVIGQVNAAQISLTAISSTFDKLRYPATCPSTPADVIVSADSYGDPTVHTVTAPLTVTGCSSLAFAPAFAVTATRDASDRQVRLATTVTQTASQAPSRSVSLAFPTAVLAPNLESIKALCQNVASGTCATVGSATATSPLYPTPLTGRAYLTGSSAGLSLTLVFPSPFPLTLTGAVDLVHNSATFTGLPDIPLTNLGVSLDGGADGLFLTTCQTPSGTATATLTDQNGDKTVTAPGRFAVAGCPGVAGGPGGGSDATGGGPNAPAVSSPSVSGLSTGHPSLRFTLTVRRHAPKLTALTVELPRGLSFAGHRVRGRLTVRGVTVRGAKVRSLSLSRGHLVITLRRAVSRLTVTLAPATLKESSALRSSAARSLRVTVLTTNARGRRATLHLRVPGTRS